MLGWDCFQKMKYPDFSKWSAFRKQALLNETKHHMPERSGPSFAHGCNKHICVIRWSKKLLSSTFRLIKPLSSSAQLQWRSEKVSRRGQIVTSIEVSSWGGRQRQEKRQRNRAWGGVACGSILVKTQRGVTLPVSVHQTSLVVDWWTQGSVSGGRAWRRSNQQTKGQVMSQALSGTWVTGRQGDCCKGVFLLHRIFL